MTSQTTRALVGADARAKAPRTCRARSASSTPPRTPTSEGLQDFLVVVGLISLALALLNLLPVLPLDGGHIVMALLERIRGRSFSQLAYLRYSAVGLTLFAVLLYLGLRNDLDGRELASTAGTIRPWAASGQFA